MNFFRAYRFIFPLIVLSSLIIFSCAPTVYDVTVDMLVQGRNDEVIARMRRSLVNSPDDPEYLKLMGVAYFNKKLYQDAVKILEQAQSIESDDDQTIYYLASCYENLKDYNNAIRYYQMYSEVTAYGEYRDLVDARIKILYRQQMHVEAQKVIQQESELEVAKIPANTVAVLYFENRGNQRTLDPLQKGLAEMLITDFSKVRSLKVVERIRLQKLVEELNFGSTGLVDEKTAPRVGKLLGAYRLVKGSYFDMVGDKVRIDALVARTKTGDLDATTNISGNMQDLFRMEKDLVLKILKEMKIRLSDDEREAILTIPTENFFAFLSYSKGIDFEDRGMYTQAVDAYSQAIKADPNFSQAKTNLTAAQKTQQIVVQPSAASGGGGGTKGASGAVVPAPLPPPPSTTAASANTLSVTNRVVTTSTIISNAGFTPGSNSNRQAPSTVTKPLPAPPGPPQ